MELLTNDVCHNIPVYSPVVLLGDALVVGALVAEPLLVELAALVDGSAVAAAEAVLLPRQGVVLETALGQGGALAGEVARLVLGQEHVQVRLKNIWSISKNI